MSAWLTIDSAPKDRQILFYGIWRSGYPLALPGMTCVQVAEWCPLFEIPKWLVGGGDRGGWPVDWTHWAELPEPPK